MIKLEPKENLILELRKHWFIIFVEGFVIFIVAVAPVVIIYFAIKFYPQILKLKLGGGDIKYFFSFIYFIWLLASWVAFFVIWTDYYLDVWYITDKRIISTDQKGLFWREVIDSRYEKIQDATVEISGVIPTLLNYGDLHVQTAGAGREIILKGARNPVRAKEIILQTHSRVLEKGGDEFEV